jgi:hypothetical protein
LQDCPLTEGFVDLGGALEGTVATDFISVACFHKPGEGLGGIGEWFIPEAEKTELVGAIEYFLYAAIGLRRGVYG